MKRFILLMLTAAISTLSFAQARYASADYNKQSKPAVIADVPFPEKTINNAIEDKFSKMGYKGSSTKGYTVYRGVSMAALGTGSYDLYFSTDKISRKDKGNSTVTMLISKGFDSFIGDTTDATLIENAKTYLNNLKDIVSAYDLEQQILDQEDNVKKADKRYNGLTDDGIDLQKKKRKIEEDIEKNLKDQKSQQEEQAKQRQMLDVLKGKRKA